MRRCGGLRTGHRKKIYLKGEDAGPYLLTQNAGIVREMSADAVFMFHGEDLRSVRTFSALCGMFREGLFCRNSV